MADKKDKKSYELTVDLVDDRAYVKEGQERKRYDAGTDVSHFSAERLKALQDKGYVKEV